MHGTLLSPLWWPNVVLVTFKEWLAGGGDRGAGLVQPRPVAGHRDGD
jgi:hypothetical protein